MPSEAIFNAAPDAVIVIDEEGKVIQWNPRAESMFGWTFSEIKGKLLSDTIIPDRYREAHKKGMTHYLQTGQGTILNRTVEIQACTKDNKEFDVALSISPTIVDDKHIFIGFLRDITVQKREIQEVNVNLEMKIKQRTAELERKNRDLEQFAYVVSHDLQEPLRTTTSFVHLLREKYHDKLDDEANQVLQYMVQGSERMKTLITDLLDYSRIGKKTELCDIDCNAAIKEVLADLDMSFREAEAIIHIDPLPQLKGYHTELKLLFQNLISNSLKFRRKDEQLVISISVLEKDQHWQFAVTDNGIGINEKFKERIFIIFQRLHVQSEYHGSGIGLAHCMKIAELHNGTIWVESIPEKGSSFYFTIQKM